MIHWTESNLSGSVVGSCGDITARVDPIYGDGISRPASRWVVIVERENPWRKAMAWQLGREGCEELAEKLAEVVR